jgi:hypothetical protein
VTELDTAALREVLEIAAEVVSLVASVLDTAALRDVLLDELDTTAL